MDGRRIWFGSQPYSPRNKPGRGDDTVEVAVVYQRKGSMKITAGRVVRYVKRLAKKDGGLLRCPTCGWEWTVWFRRRTPISRPYYEVFGPFFVDGGNATRRTTVEEWVDEYPDCVKALLS